MGFFDKYTNYNNQAGVSSVVFGANRPVLEVELNEMQEVSKELLRNMIAKVCGNGVTDISKITYENGAVKIASGCGIAVDGILINCTGLSKSATSGTIYLQVWEETVDYADTLKKEGNQQESATVTNYIKDSRANEETTRRMVVKYDLATSTNSSRHNLAIASISDGKMTRLVNEINLSNIRAELDDAKGYIDIDIYGVEVDFENKKFTRLAGAVEKMPGADFDNIRPWNRRRCNVTDDGKVVAYYGDEGYTETGKLTQAIAIGGNTYSVGTRVQVMVEQPKFYYKVVPLQLEKIQNGKGYHIRKARYYVSDVPKADFKLHPAFISDRKEKDFIYLSAFEGSLFDVSSENYILNDKQIADFNADMLSSIANAKPISGKTQSLTRTNTRKLANNRGTGWEQAYAATVSATQLLFTIEYASMNSQIAIGDGVTGRPYGEGNEADITGLTTHLGNASGSVETGSVSYRGEENFWGNTTTWVDGINVYGDPETKKTDAYVADHGFTDDVKAEPYKDVGFSLASYSSGSYISAFGYNEEFDYLFLPSEVLGNSALPVGDAFYNTQTGWRVASLGGYWSHGTSGGGFCWCVNYDSGYSFRSRGGRLVYVP